MTHLAFIIPAYGLTVLVVGWLCVDAVLRTRRARATLDKIDPRAQR
jgi:heme exporter protein CcmD